MANICLVIPPSGFLLNDRVFPSLGILHVAAALEKAGKGVHMLDLSGINNFVEVLSRYLDENKDTSVFGFTAVTPQMPVATQLAQALRSLRPKARIILGGPHPTLIVASLRYAQKYGKIGLRAEREYNALTAHFDVIVAGDGEEAIFVALDPNSPQLIDGDDRHSTLWQGAAKRAEHAFPARGLIDLESYKYSIDGHPATSIISQLGCPFECSFCGGRFSPMLRHIRTRPVEHIILEMEHIHSRWGHTGFMFYDDELNVNAKEMLQLMEGIFGLQKRLGVEFRLRGFIKAELFTEEQARAMYRAGFRWILVGFESGSPRILTNIKKRATREDNTRCVEIAHKYGLKVKALMSIGHPGESQETIQETRDWLMKTRSDDFDLTLITTYPGTPYYDLATPTEEEGVWVFVAPNGDKLFQREVNYAEVANYYKGVPGHYTSHVWSGHLSSEELVFERDASEVYLREKLGIPFNAGAAVIDYEHSMGMGGLNKYVLRSTSAQ